MAQKEEGYVEERSEQRMRENRPVRDKLEENFDLHPPFKTAALSHEPKECAISNLGRTLLEQKSLITPTPVMPVTPLNLVKE